MPGPESGVTIQRPDLGALAYEHLGDAESNGFIAQEVLPNFNVTQKNANYPIIPREVMLKLPDVNRAPRGAYSRADWAFNQGNYDCAEYGWEEVMDDSEAALYSRFFDAELVGTLRAVNILQRSYEKRVADAVFNATTWTAVTVTNEWDDSANATPLADVDAGKIVMRNNTGLVPNTLIIAYSTFLDLGKSTEIIDRIKYTTNANVIPGALSPTLLAQYFGIDRVLVGNAIYDATLKGQSMATATSIWSNEYAMLCRIGAGNDILAPVLGRTFLWTADSPGILNTETYRENQTRGDVVRVRHNVDEKIINVQAGYLLDNITT